MIALRIGISLRRTSAALSVSDISSPLSIELYSTSYGVIRLSGWPLSSPSRRPRDRRCAPNDAEVTRRRIVAAARVLFARDGYGATTLRGIATEAGVAVQTVYAVYGSKAGTLAALLDSAGPASRRRSPPSATPWPSVRRSAGWTSSPARSASDGSSRATSSPFTATRRRRIHLCGPRSRRLNEPAGTGSRRSRARSRSGCDLGSTSPGRRQSSTRSRSPRSTRSSSRSRDGRPTSSRCGSRRRFVASCSRLSAVGAHACRGARRMLGARLVGIHRAAG